jgi:hypothetical protein
MTKRPWFKGRKYGYGWGMPTVKEGWLVLVSYFLLIILDTIQVGSTPTQEQLMFYVLQVLLTSALLLTICYATGDKPQWHWEEKKRKN